MKILITTHYFLPHLGGIEFVAYNQAKELVKKGHKVTVISSKIGDEKEKETIDGIKVIRIKAWNVFEKNWGIPYPVFSPKLLSVLNQEIKDSDVISMYGHIYLPSVIGTYIARKLKKQFVLTQQNNYVHYKNPFFNLMESIADKTLGKYVLNSAKKIIVVSNQTKKYVKSIIKKYKRVSIIYNGIDLKEFSVNKIREKKNTKNNIILFTGRYVDIKGVNELVNVAKQLPQYEFWFAGNGILNDIIKGENINNLGFKTTKELVRLYNKATICVFPSWHEPFGLVGLEAMACGKPVIATPLGFSEYIENEKDGIIIPAKDEKALKDAIVRLMNDKKLRDNLSKNAIKKAPKYSWNKIAKQYLEVFKEVIRK